MKPISLMRLKKLSDPKDILEYYKSEDLYIEPKYDGFKIFYSNNNFYTRRGINVTENISFLLDYLPKNITLLGELVFYVKGKQSLSHIQSIINSNPNHAQKMLKQFKGKLIFWVYDILEFNNENITKLPLFKRRKILKQLVKPNKYIKISPIYRFTDHKKVISKSLKEGGEGIILKPKESIYKYNSFNEHEPVGEWFKYKPYENEEVILNNYFYRRKEKKAIFPAYQYKDGKLFEVGKLSGMDRLKEKELISKINKGQTLVVEVNYQEKYPSGKIRAMGWVRDRTKEKSPKSVIWQK